MQLKIVGNGLDQAEKKKIKDEREHGTVLPSLFPHVRVSHDVGKENSGSFSSTSCDVAVGYASQRSRFGAYRLLSVCKHRKYLEIYDASDVSA